MKNYLALLFIGSAFALAGCETISGRLRYIPDGSAPGDHN